MLLEVPPKAAELLAALASDAGEVVTKEELLRRVWPDTFVEEANLSVNVSILRKALGEQPDGRAWIQTVARRGYRFLGAVRAQARAPRSLAVLPFRSLGTDEAEDALGLGMADALITRLAATGRVAVRPTGTVRRFASADVDPVEAGRQLGVDAVVDGRLQRSGSRLRLTVQLVPTGGGSAPVGRPLRRGVHAPLRRRGHGRRARGGGPRGGAEHRGATEARPPPDREPRGLPGLLPGSLLLGPLLAALGREGDAELPRGHGPRPPLRAAARRPRGRVPRGGLRRRSPAARGLGARGGVVPPGPGPRRPDPGAPRLGGLSPPPAGLGLGRRREPSCGAPSRSHPSPRRLTSGSASCWTSAATRARRPARSFGPRSWTRCPWSSPLSPACTTPSPASTRPSSPRPGARSSSTRTSSSATGRWGARFRTSGATAKRWTSTRVALDLAEGTAFMRPVLARSLALAGRVDEARAILAPGRPDRCLTVPGGDGPSRARGRRAVRSSSWLRRQRSATRGSCSSPSTRCCDRCEATRATRRSSGGCEGADFRRSPLR